MKPLTANDAETKSPDQVAENFAKLKAMFPDAVTEDGVNVDVLKQLLGKTVTDAEEKYGLNWHGKRKARQLALTPSTGTLRPCPEDSVAWDTTRNLMIEGDNLEVLKLLQKSYAGKVKLIYIDPPYNTGGDFVYPDDFQDSIKNYLALTGQVEGGQKISSNSEASGRFHTDWLNMMYPRLKLARNLLHKDGILLVSIDDGELATLRLILNDIYGEENFIACFVWKSRQNKDNRSKNGASKDHEYVVCYGQRIRGDARDKTQYSNPDNDSRGPWASANMVGLATADRRPNLHYDLTNPKTSIKYVCPEMGWRYDRTTMARLISEECILWPSSLEGRPRRKAFLADLESDFTGYSTMVGENIYTKHGTAVIDELFGFRAFDFPKPVELIRELVEQGTAGDDIVLDFFAGSGTTAHAVMSQNTADKGQRRFIVAQLPEPLDPSVAEQKASADFCKKLGKPQNIAELTKERLRRAGQKIREENPMFSGDLGFRVFKLASSNIQAWEPDRERLAETLEASVDHLKTDRTESDILFELLLKLGLDLTVPIETHTIAGQQVHSIGAGTLLVCLSKTIAAKEVEPLALGVAAWHKTQAPAGESTIVFRDSAFADDVAKTNLTAILQQHGLENVRSL